MGEKIKITRDNLFGVNTALQNIPVKLKKQDVKINNQLKYGIKKNKDLIKGEIEAIREVLKTNIPGFEEYEKKRNDKIREFAKKDSIGNPVQENGIINIGPDNVKAYTEFMETLNEEYKEDLKKRDEEIKENEKFILEEIEIEIYKISNDCLPVEVDQSDYEMIFPIIYDEI